MKRILPGLLVIPFLTALAYACSPPVTPGPAVSPPAKSAAQTGPEWKQKWDKVVRAAEKEGQLTLYTSIGTSARDVVLKGMKEKFGLGVEFVTGRGAEVAEKAVSEQRAGLYLADAFIIGSVNIITNLKPPKVVQPIEPFLILPEVKDPKAWVGGGLPFAEKDRVGFGIAASWDTYVTVNLDYIKKEEIVSYYDLLKPGYKGKIAMFDPIRGGTGQAAVAHMVYVLGDVEGKKLIQGLAKQQPVITNDYRQLTEWVARGKYPIGIGTRVTETTDFVKLGVPLHVVRVKEGGKIGTAGGTLAVSVKPAHPNAAALFVNWILSKEGGTLFQKGYANPSGREDVPKDANDPHVVRSGEKLYIETEETIMHKDSLVPWSKQVFAPLMGGAK